MKKITSLLSFFLFCWSITAQENIKAEKYFSESKRFMAEKLYDNAIESIDSAIKLDSLKEDYYIQKIDICQKKNGL